MNKSPRQNRSRSGLPGEELDELVSLCTPHLEGLAGANILITGSTGWFGTWLLDFLCRADDAFDMGVRITAVSRQPAAFLSKFPAFRDDRRVVWIESDVRQLKQDTKEFTHVIHAATDSSAKTTPLNAQQQFDTIVEGTRRALECVGWACKSFVLVSSGAIYGPARPGEIRFLDSQSGGPDPASPNSVYAEGKRAAEQLCAIAVTRGVPVRTARCFALVGPHMPFDKHFAIGNFIADAAEGRPIRVQSDGKPQRSYMYMSDLVRALVAILIDGCAGRTYNVGSEVGITIKELAERVNLLIGGSGVIVAGNASDPGDRYVPDTGRMRTELKINPVVSLDTAIARTAAWYREFAE